MAAKLPPRPDKTDPAAYWSWIALACEWCAGSCGFASPPEYLSFHHTEEYKEGAEREAIEEQASPRSRELVILVLEGKRLPRNEETAFFFVGERFHFAQMMAKALATNANSSKPGGVASCPTDAPIETIKWLALDVYDAGHFWKHRWANTPREW